jgi:heptosyltransferase I
MKILLVKLSSLGDVVQTMPVVQDILRHWSDAQVDWVVEEAFAPLVAQVQGLRRVLPYGGRRWRKSKGDAAAQPAVLAERKAFDDRLREETYDAVIDLQGLIKSALVARRGRLATGGFSVTYGNKSEACGYEWPVKWMVSRTVPMPKRIHAVARGRLLAAEALGYRSNGPAGYVWRPQAAIEKIANQIPQDTVLLAHGTTRPDNEWPRAAWTGLARRLLAQGLAVAMPQASDAEQAWAEGLLEDLRLDGADASGVRVWPRMDLAQLRGAMARCAGVVGVDSGLSHLAVALELPHVQIFSQDRAWRAGPLPVQDGGLPHQLAVGGASAPDLDAVWLAWQQAWAARPDGQAP